MDENSSLKQFLDEIGSYGDAESVPGRVPHAPSDPQLAIGRVLEIAGSGSAVVMDSAALHALATNADPSLAMSGQVGSQIKMQVAGSWLIANVRTLGYLYLGLRGWQPHPK